MAFLMKTSETTNNFLQGIFDLKKKYILPKPSRTYSNLYKKFPSSED
jgi:hypothetical protein